jgi:hypothetical protein
VTWPFENAGGPFFPEWENNATITQLSAMTEPGPATNNVSGF